MHTYSVTSNVPGGFGKVMLVRKRGGEEVYAMKVLKKEALVRRNQVYTMSMSMYYVYYVLACACACIKCSTLEGGAPSRCGILTDVVPLSGETGWS